MNIKSAQAAAAALVLLAATGLWAKPTAAEKSAAREKIKQGALVVDVRTAAEFAEGHHPAATNLPVQELSKRWRELGDTNRAVVVYCASGYRSGKAQAILQKAGFRDVTNAGGISDVQP